jgi:hypothetical protein
VAALRVTRASGASRIRNALSKWQRTPQGGSSVDVPVGRDCSPAPGPAHSSLPATCVTCQCRTSTEPCSNLRLRCRLLCVPTCTASARYTGPITSRQSMSLHSQGCIESHRTRLQEQSSRTRRTGYSALSCVLPGVASQDCTVRLLCRTDRIDHCTAD